MRAAWLFPKNRRCGISIYSERYIRELSKEIEISQIDIAPSICSDHDIIKKINSSDLLHIQYEPSFFVNNGSDYYSRFVRKIDVPVFVTLHEVYEKFPGVFPRSEISGNYLVKFIKRLLYDIKHPVVTSYRKNLNRSMYAEKIIVQYEYQKKILNEKYLPGADIEVIPMPVVEVKNTKKNYSAHEDDNLSVPEKKVNHKKHDGPIIGYNGFINPNYDYTSLFNVLSALDCGWKFIWIGGIRNPGDEVVLNRIISDVEKKGWHDRFIITGWKGEEKKHEMLKQVDCFAALFKSKSGSSSLMEAFSEELVSVAFKSPLTDELNAQREVVINSDHELPAMVSAIKTALFDKQKRSVIKNNLREFNKRCNYAKMSEKLISIYKKRSGH